MKKIIFILIAAFAISLTSCSKDTTEPSPTSNGCTSVI